MTTAQPQPQQPKPAIPSLEENEDLEWKAKLSKLASMPEFCAAQTIFGSLCEPGTTDIGALLTSLHNASNAVNNGDLTGPESIAITQAMTLDFLFHNLLRTAMANMDTSRFEQLMRLALRAQSQSSRTLETLAALKNPVVFAKQLNVAEQQIVSNIPASKRLSRARAPSSPPALEAPREEIVRSSKSKILPRARAPVNR